LANYRFRSLICAFPYVTVADYAAFIDEHNGRPCPHAVAVPNLETVVLNHGIFDAELCRGFLDARERSFPEKFGRMNIYDRQTRPFVFFVPVPQLRDRISTIDSAISPEFNQHDAVLQRGETKRFAIKPSFPGEFGCALAQGNSVAEPRPENQRSKEQSDRDRADCPPRDPVCHYCELRGAPRGAVHSSLDGAAAALVALDELTPHNGPKAWPSADIAWNLSRKINEAGRKATGDLQSRCLNRPDARIS